MTVGHWRDRFIPLVLAALLGACEDPDPLAPSFAGSSGGSTVAAPTKSPWANVSFIRWCATRQRFSAARAFAISLAAGASSG